MSDAHRVIGGMNLGIGAATFLAAGAARGPAGPVGVCPDLVRAVLAKSRQLQADNDALAAQVQSLSRQLAVLRAGPPASRR